MGRGNPPGRGRHRRPVDRMQVVAQAAAGEPDVARLPVERVRVEQHRLLAGHALGLVNGHGTAVVEPAVGQTRHRALGM